MSNTEGPGNTTHNGLIIVVDEAALLFEPHAGPQGRDHVRWMWDIDTDIQAYEKLAAVLGNIQKIQKMRGRRS